MSDARFGARAQSASSIALAAFAVHQLRYLVASGAGQDGLARLGHAYLGHLPPLLVGFAVAAAVAAVMRGRGDSDRRVGRNLGAAFFALGVVAVFCGQELLEGALIAGHAGDVAAIFSSGGWAAVPLAALFGLLAAVIDRGIESVETRLAICTACVASAPATIGAPGSGQFLMRRCSPLALGIATRPPPTLS
ncbi:MAG: hypothetical protein J0H06_02385 [Actinobacteria bacterium]|nr:hypothetical protein [Actinomycetota bacterium]